METTQPEGSLPNSLQEMKGKIYQDVLQFELRETILEENPLKAALEKKKLAAVK